MTLLGKIFTVLILVMSVAFSVLAVLTFATHRNWQQTAQNLKTQNEQKDALIRQHQAQIEVLTGELATEKAARVAALATLQGRNQLFRDDLEQLAQELQTKTSALTAQTVAASTAEQTLADITAEVQKLREEIRVAQLDRDQQFSRAVDLTDKLNAAEALRSTLEEKNSQLLEQYARLDRVATAMGFTPDTPHEHIPPPVDGRVLKVREATGLVEISLGSDDGLKRGHTLEVYRGNRYLGRIIIRELDPDRAVGQIDKRMQQSRIQEGDVVTTKLS
jgi:hypothetical protein